MRAMTLADVPRVAELHAAHLSYSFFAKLGLGFLRRLYRRIVLSEHGFGFVVEVDGRVDAFITASLDAATLRRELIWRDGCIAGCRVLLALLRRPWLAMRVFETLAYGSRTDLDGVRAEMLFISIEPELRRRGLAVEFIRRVLEEYVARGVQRAKVVTEAVNEPVNMLLAKFGFEPVSEFRLHGKPMRLHMRALDSPNQ